jgi:hypothetical protein
VAGSSAARRDAASISLTGTIFSVAFDIEGWTLVAALIVEKALRHAMEGYL